ncbi:MAG: hypothetical protein RL173_407 [Fibrobacterota bacterium]|jgi:ankyrin repeat protein
MTAINNTNIFAEAQYGEINHFQSLFIRESINNADSQGSTLLHLAIVGEKYDIAEFLLEQGADVNATDADKQTPLHLIATKQNANLAEKILRIGANINARDKWSNTPMWTATFNCKGRFYEMVELFLRYQPDLRTKNKSGKSPMDFAIQVGNTRLIKLFEESLSRLASDK